MTEQSKAIVATEGFGSSIQQQQVETATTAMAALARANVEAACIMAERHPRDWLDVRARLLKECQRPGFAEAARYTLPRSSFNRETGKYEKKDITGFSIRFAEAAARNMRNIGVTATVTYEDDEKRIIDVTARDFESNYTTGTVLSVSKRVERRRLKKGEVPIGKRANSEGEIIFIVAATDDEVLQKTNSAIAKAKRQLILSLLPGDIQDDALEEISSTKKNKFAKDPTKEIKRITDSFARINVLPAQLAAYLGHSVDTISEAELDDLRGIYVAIQDGSISWVDVIGRAGEEEEETKEREARTAAAVETARKTVEAKRKGKAGDGVASKPIEAHGTEVPEETTPEPLRMREPGED